MSYFESLLKAHPLSYRPAGIALHYFDVAFMEDDRVRAIARVRYSDTFAMLDVEMMSLYDPEIIRKLNHTGIELHSKTSQTLRDGHREIYKDLLTYGKSEHAEKIFYIKPYDNTALTLVVVDRDPALADPDEDVIVGDFPEGVIPFPSRTRAA